MRRTLPDFRLCSRRREPKRSRSRSLLRSLLVQCRASPKQRAAFLLAMSGELRARADMPADAVAGLPIRSEGNQGSDIYQQEDLVDPLAIDSPSWSAFFRRCSRERIWPGGRVMIVLVTWHRAPQSWELGTDHYLCGSERRFERSTYAEE